MSSRPKREDQEVIEYPERLREACKQGDLETVRKLVERSASIEANRGECPPLHYACAGGHLEGVRFLLHNGANVRIFQEFNDREDCTAIDHACETGNVDLVNLLLLSGAETENEEWVKEPLYIACKKRHLEVVQALIAHDVRMDPRHKGMTPLIYACKVGSVKVVQLLISNGVWIDGPDHHSRTPLHYACEFGHEQVVSLLLYNGARVYAEDSLGEQPIHKACKTGQIAVVLALIDLSGSADIQHHKLGTPLHYACKVEQYDVVKFLLLQGASVDARDIAGRTPLHLACESGNSLIVDLLLSRGAKVYLDDNRKRHIVSQRGHICITKAVLPGDASIVFCRDDLGKTPLTIACVNGNVELVRLLLTYTADVQGLTAHLEHPLREACRFSHVEIVEALLAHGAKVDNIGTDSPRRLKPRRRYHPRRLDNVEFEELEVLGFMFDLRPQNLLLEDIDTHNRLLLEDVESEEVARLLILHGADVNAPASCGETLLQSCNKSCNIIRLLLDYGAGSGRPCRRRDCACHTTELMCFYRSSEYDVDIFDSFFPRKIASQSVFERFFIKKNAAGLGVENETAKEPGDWDEIRRSAFRAKCDTELGRMKDQTIDNTSATYHDLLTRNLAALRYQQILGNFDPKECVKHFPIYGDMTVCSYLQLREFFLKYQSATFFLLTVPQLSLDCAERVVVHLSDEDMKNLVKIILAS